MTTVKAHPRRPVVILQAAPAKRPGETASTEQRLFELAGVASRAQLESRYAFDFLLLYAAPSREALKEAGQLYRFRPGYWYLLMGTEVIRALGKRALPLPPEVPWHADRAPLLEWYAARVSAVKMTPPHVLTPVVMAILPHPTTRNRWYDSPVCQRAAEKFLRAAAWKAGAAQKRWLSRA